MATTRTTRVRISKELDIFKAAEKAKSAAYELGFTQVKQMMVSTVVSELARNIYTYALKGEIIIKRLVRGDKKGIEIIAQDEGPGIDDIATAMQDLFSTGNTLGLGLPGSKRMMDEFSFDTSRRVGIKIVARKWM